MLPVMIRLGLEVVPTIKVQAIIVAEEEVMEPTTEVLIVLDHTEKMVMNKIRRGLKHMILTNRTGQLTVINTYKKKGTINNITVKEEEEEDQIGLVEEGTLIIIAEAEIITRLTELLNLY